MSFWRDRESRHFFRTVILLCVLLLVFAGAAGLEQSRSAKQMLLRQNANVAGALLREGVPAGTIAAAITGKADDGAGEALLVQLGLSQEAGIGFIPLARDFAAQTAVYTATGWILFTVLLAAACIRYLRRREKLYVHASGIVSRYTEDDFTGRLPRDGEGALHKLFGSVNNMATALQAKGEAQYQAREFLKQIISDISHQLKTPLAALHMYNEIIAGEPDQPGTVAMFSEKTAAAIRRMEQLIQALLKMARLDAGSITFDTKPCYVSELVAQAVECGAPEAIGDRRVKVSGDPGEQIRCDLQWTREAVGNIIQNAVEHSGPEGDILIHWEHHPGMVRLTVEDHGTGIAQEDIHHIFKRFYRSPHSRSTQGLGLGLPLAKAIIEGQGGIVSVHSTVKKGTVFTISFLTNP
jgi:signal transduction histidine kinase